MSGKELVKPSCKGETDSELLPVKLTAGVQNDDITNLQRLLFRGSVEWDSCRLEELRSTGKNKTIDEEKVIRNIAPDISKYVDIIAFLPYFKKRGRYITYADEEVLKRIANPMERANMFVGFLIPLSTRSRAILPDLLLSLMDMCEAADGGTALYNHWTFVQILLDTVLSVNGSSYREPDVAEAVKKLSWFEFDEAHAILLANSLGVSSEEFSSYDEVCQKWLLEGKERCTLTNLVRALLLTPGFGRLVSGISTPCRCNPPAVSSWFRNLPDGGWRTVLYSIGYTRAEVRWIDNKFYNDPNIIPQMILRSLRIPNCGRETEDILKRLAVNTRVKEIHERVPQVPRQISRPPAVGDSAVQNLILALGASLASPQRALLPPPVEYTTWTVPQCEIRELPAPMSKVGPVETDSTNERCYGDVEVPSVSIVSDLPCSASESRQSSTTLPANVLPTSTASENSGACTSDEVEPSACGSQVLASTASDSCLAAASYQVSHDGTDLLKACKTGDWDMATVLLQSQAFFVEAHDSEGRTALYYATEGGKDDIVHSLLAYGADESKLLHLKHMSSLLEACKTHDWNLAKGLLRSQDTIFTEACCQEDDKTALHYACEGGDQELIEQLVDKGADVTRLNKEGLSVLHILKVLRDQDILVKLLEEFARRKVPVDSESSVNHNTPLMIVCNEGDSLYSSAELLLDNGASPDGSRQAHSRPMIVACQRGHKRLAELLVSRHVDINAQDKNGNTALLQACKTRQTNIVNDLLELPDININRSDKSGTTPLFEAISANNYQTVLKLLDKGARVNATRQVSNEIMMGSVEETPLAHACSRGFEKVVDLLIDRGADVNFKCSDTVPPIGFAIICRHMNVVRMLLKCNSLDTSIYGLTGPIIIAVKVENFECTKLLVDKLGGTEKALQMASENQLEELLTHIVLYSTADPVNASLQEKHYEEHAAATRSSTGPTGLTQAEKQVVLEQFCHICVLALRQIEVDRNVTQDDLVSTATAIHPGNCDIAGFFRQVANHTLSMSAIRSNFLGGSPSPLSFLINQKILTCEDFVAQALKFFDNEPEEFYHNLIAAFHMISGGENLPNDIQSVLNRLFNGQFSINLRFGGRGGGDNFPPDSALPAGFRRSSFGPPHGTQRVESSEPGWNPTRLNVPQQDSPHRFPGQGHTLRPATLANRSAVVQHDNQVYTNIPPASQPPHQQHPNDYQHPPCSQPPHQQHPDDHQHPPCSQPPHQQPLNDHQQPLYSQPSHPQPPNDHQQPPYSQSSHRQPPDDQQQLPYSQPPHQQPPNDHQQPPYSQSSHQQPPDDHQQSSYSQLSHPQPPNDHQQQAARIDRLPSPPIETPHYHQPSPSHLQQQTTTTNHQIPATSIVSINQNTSINGPCVQSYYYHDNRNSVLSMPLSPNSSHQATAEQTSCIPRLVDSNSEIDASTECLPETSSNQNETENLSTPNTTNLNDVHELEVSPLFTQQQNLGHESPLTDPISRNPPERMTAVGGLSASAGVPSNIPSYGEDVETDGIRPRRLLTRQDEPLSDCPSYDRPLTPETPEEDRPKFDNLMAPRQRSSEGNNSQREIDSGYPEDTSGRNTASSSHTFTNSDHESVTNKHPYETPKHPVQRKSRIPLPVSNSKRTYKLSSFVSPPVNVDTVDSKSLTLLSTEKSLTFVSPHTDSNPVKRSNTQTNKKSPKLLLRSSSQTTPTQNHCLPLSKKKATPNKTTSQQSPRLPTSSTRSVLKRKKVPLPASDGRHPQSQDYRRSKSTPERSTRDSTLLAVKKSKSETKEDDCKCSHLQMQLSKTPTNSLVHMLIGLHKIYEYTHYSLSVSHNGEQVICSDTILELRTDLEVKEELEMIFVGFRCTTALPQDSLIDVVRQFKCIQLIQRCGIIVCTCHSELNLNTFIY